MEQCVEWLNERLLEDCLGRQRAMAIYIVGGWDCLGFNTMCVGSTRTMLVDWQKRFLTTTSEKLE
jgi:hypothetical protein